MVDGKLNLQRIKSCRAYPHQKNCRAYSYRGGWSTAQGNETDTGTHSLSSCQTQRAHTGDSESPRGAARHHRTRTAAQG